MQTSIERKACAFEIAVRGRESSAKKAPKVIERLEASLEKAAASPTITKEQIEEKLARAAQKRQENFLSGGSCDDNRHLKVRERKRNRDQEKERLLLERLRKSDEKLSKRSHYVERIINKVKGHNEKVSEVVTLKNQTEATKRQERLERMISKQILAEVRREELIEKVKSNAIHAQKVIEAFILSKNQGAPDSESAPAIDQ